MARAEFDPSTILATLTRHDLRFVLIGGLAASAYGVVWATFDVDVVIDASAENQSALLRALTELGAVFDTMHRPPIPPDAARIASATGPMLFRTRSGRLDVLKEAGGETYASLAPGAFARRIVGTAVQVASLASIARMKRVANRKKDLVVLPEIERALVELEAREAVFRSEAGVPESKRHLELRTLLYLVIKRAFAATATIGSEQFVYFSASDPRKCVAPDVFVRRGAADHDSATWKTWERGAPELAVEIISESEGVVSWEEKVQSYHELGIVELVRFDAAAPAGSQLRVWDRVEGDLVERVVEGDRTPCNVLGGEWLVRPTAGYPAGLRLVDASGLVLPTAEERVAELEALLAKR